MESVVSTHNSNQVLGGGEDWVLEKMVGASHRCWEREWSQLREGQFEEFRPTVGQRASLKVVSRGQAVQADLHIRRVTWQQHRGYDDGRG